MAGLLLQLAIPAHVVADGRGAVGSVIGVVALLIALVLGLLIWTSYGVFAVQQAQGVQAAAALVITLSIGRVQTVCPQARTERLVQGGQQGAAVQFVGAGLHGSPSVSSAPGSDRFGPCSPPEQLQV